MHSSMNSAAIQIIVNNLVGRVFNFLEALLKNRLPKTPRLNGMLLLITPPLFCRLSLSRSIGILFSAYPSFFVRNSVLAGEIFFLFNECFKYNV